MGYANFETTHIDYVCVYCGNENLVIDDDFDEHGNYGGTRYYCTCEKAKLEQEMKRKMEEMESEKNKIFQQYQPLLGYDKYVIAKRELIEQLTNLTKNFITYGDLKKMSKGEFLDICERIHDDWGYEEDEEKFK